MTNLTPGNVRVRSSPAVSGTSASPARLTPPSVYVSQGLSTAERNANAHWRLLDFGCRMTRETLRNDYIVRVRKTMTS
jgi:hypothetical protein